MLRHLMPAHDTAHCEHPLDRMLRAWIDPFTQGVSPEALYLAYADWLAHLTAHPSKQIELVNAAWQKWARLSDYLAGPAFDPDHKPCIEPKPGDDRFTAPQWKRWPFNAIYQSFLLSQTWWHTATIGVRGVNPHHQEVVHFVGRQLLDMFSPSNYLLTNPEILDLTLASRGENLLKGFGNYLEDRQRKVKGQPPAGVEEFKVGGNLALSQGKVIYRNRLIELIQYEPATRKVHAQPVLFVPAWIMKYYILDLRPSRSLVEYLVSQGHTVFMVSWKNPTSTDRDLGLDDYRQLGVMEALEAVRTLVPEQPVHAVGYCLGGTLLMIAAAAMARDGDERLASVSLFAAQSDFREPGEIDLFIDESQVAFLEDHMRDKGYLDAYQMASAFQLLRSNDLIWSRMVRDYLLGEREAMIDLMAWNADATRLPQRMHSEYLRQLFLNNDLAEGRYDVGGQPIHLGDIRAPIFAVGTIKDHVAPWKSVYKINRLTRAEVTFLLTSGGHNAGIITPPGHPRRKFQLHTRQSSDPFMAPDAFHQQMPTQNGSWWPAWQAWLKERSGPPVAPPPLGAPDRGYPPLGDAPGEYVLQK